MKDCVFSPYKSIFFTGFSVPCFYKDDVGRVVLIEDEISEIFTIKDNSLKSLGFEWEEKFNNRSYKVATRKEIKEAGLWDFVENKEDYSSEQEKIDDELDEYLRIGEEIEKEKQNTDAGIQ